MPGRNPESPWNPGKQTKITPQDYESQVVDWLKATGGTVESFEVKHLEYISGAGGEYEFDAVVRFTILNGAQIVILIECKRYSRPVDREKVLALWAKAQDVGAHKAMVFSTSGFQSGALDYAKAHGIATVTFVDGAYLYQTKSAGPPVPPPPWLSLPDYAGIFMTKTDSGVICNTIDQKQADILLEWLQS